jgi:hypothetical protein
MSNHGRAGCASAGTGPSDERAAMRLFRSGSPQGPRYLRREDDRLQMARWDKHLRQLL